MKKVFYALTLLFLASATFTNFKICADTQDQHTKADAITTLLEESSFSKAYRDNLEHMIEKFALVDDPRVMDLLKETNDKVLASTRVIMMQFYDSHFTLEEINELLAWQRSPLAQKAIALGKALTNVLAPIVQKHNAEFIEKLRALAATLKKSTKNSTPIKHKNSQPVKHIKRKAQRSNRTTR